MTDSVLTREMGLAVATMKDPQGFIVVLNADDYPVSVHEDRREAEQMAAHYDKASGPYRTLSLWGDVARAKRILPTPEKGT